MLGQDKVRDQPVQRAAQRLVLQEGLTPLRSQCPPAEKETREAVLEIPLGLAVAAVRFDGLRPALKRAQGDGLGGAVSASLNELFSSFFKPDEEKQAEIDRAYAEQLEVAARRKNPKASAEYMRATEKRRRESSAAFADKFAWQRGKEDPLVEWKKRQKEGKLNPLGYEDEPKGGIPMPMASFGVGGEFGDGCVLDD